MSNTTTKRTNPSARIMRQGYKVHAAKVGQDQKFRRYTLTLPPVMAELVNEDQLFQPEFTDEGILYRRLDQTPEREQPSWVKRLTGRKAE